MKDLYTLKLKRMILVFFSLFLSDPVLTRYLPLGEPYPEKEIVRHVNSRVDHWHLHQFGSYLLRLKSNEEVIGYCGLEHVGETGFIDIRYGVLQKYWGKGFAKEAASRVLECGLKELALDMVYGVAVPGNIASVEILKKIGMTVCSGVDFYEAEVDYYCLKKTDFENQLT